MIVDDEIKEEFFRVLRENPPQHPEADWPPLFCFLKEGVLTNVDMGDFNPLENELTKDILSTFMSEVVRRTQADAVVFVSTVWHVAYTEEASKKIGVAYKRFVEEHGREPRSYAELGVIKPEHDPDRTEKVIVQLMDAENVELYTASIKRYADEPPSLGEFEAEDEPRVAAGRFVTPIQEAFREVANTA